MSPSIDLSVLTLYQWNQFKNFIFSIWYVWSMKPFHSHSTVAQNIAHRNSGNVTKNNNWVRNIGNRKWFFFTSCFHFFWTCVSTFSVLPNSISHFLKCYIWVVCQISSHCLKNNVITRLDSEIIWLLNWLIFKLIDWLFLKNMASKILDTQIMETFPVFLCLDAVITSIKKVEGENILKQDCSNEEDEN